jgi:hypothetical protein
MTIIHRVKPYEMEDFFRVFRHNYAGETVTVTVDAPMAETQDEVNQRILASAIAAKTGKPPFMSMSLDEFEELAKGACA